MGETDNNSKHLVALIPLAWYVVMGALGRRAT